MRERLINLLTCLALIIAPSFAFADGAATRPTLYLVGDSTVHVGNPAQLGWGEPFIPLFDAAKINVLNKAMGGRSSRTFIEEGRWDAILKTLASGDYVIVQMGHNDSSPLAGDDRERGTLPGIGEETQNVTLTLEPNKGKQVTVHTYGWYLRKYVHEAKEKGATPILCSPVPRCPKAKDQVKVPAEPQAHALWAQQVAAAEQVAFIDLNRTIWRKWVDEELTPEQIKEKYFTKIDFTHTGVAGAALNASAVVDGIRRLDLPLKDALK